MIRLLHVSDTHFGRKNLPEQIDAIEALIVRERFDVVAVSGDISQRARDWEFERARGFLQRIAFISQVIAVPGNHDCTWWRAPFHLGPRSWMYAKWRSYMGRETEPVLRVTGAAFIGVTTALGISVHTLTKRLRDLSVIGDMRDDQLRRIERECAATPAADRRIVVMHHNPVAGALSHRFGFKREHAAHILREFSRMRVDLVLCGHDHQEVVTQVDHPTGPVIVSVAGTISTMSRGGRPTSVTAFDITPSAISARVMAWDGRSFVPSLKRQFSAS